MQFRDATPADIPTIRALAERIWWACYRGMIPDAQIRYMLDRMYAPGRIALELAGNVRWELVEAEAGESSAPTASDAVGYLAWEFEEEEAVVHLHKLYLDPAFQGRGIGQAMLDRVREAARRLGAAGIRLRVNRGNHRALRAYDRAGFRILGDDRADIGNGFVMDDHILILPTA